jgi:carbonic anhydrase
MWNCYIVAWEREFLMRKKFFRFLTAAMSVLLLIAFSLDASPASEVHWSYSGEEGPENWGNLSPTFKEAIGDAQSPVNITDISTKSAGDEIVFFYEDGDFSIFNNGHTLQLTPDEGGRSYVVLDGAKYHLRQLHFHTPSEHTLNGTAASMEIHFVHGNDDGKLAVVGLFIDAGTGNEAIEAAWNVAPKSRGEAEKIGQSFPLTSLLPRSLAGVRYEGSLTTPPTTEGVSWMILNEHGEASPEQIRRFTEVIGKNARPIQPLNGRSLFPFQGKFGQ